MVYGARWTTEEDSCLLSSVKEQQEKKEFNDSDCTIMSWDRETNKATTTKMPRYGGKINFKEISDIMVEKGFNRKEDSCSLRFLRIDPTLRDPSTHPFTEEEDNTIIDFFNDTPNFNSAGKQKWRELENEMDRRSRFVISSHWNTNLKSQKDRIETRFYEDLIRNGYKINTADDDRIGNEYYYFSKVKDKTVANPGKIVAYYPENLDSNLEPEWLLLYPDFDWKIVRENDFTNNMSIIKKRTLNDDNKENVAEKKSNSSSSKKQKG